MTGNTLSPFGCVTLHPGPVCSVLVNRFGCRPVMMVGGLFASLGMVLASFSTSIVHIYLTAGVITGQTGPPGSYSDIRPLLTQLNTPTPSQTCISHIELTIRRTSDCIPMNVSHYSAVQPLCMPSSSLCWIFISLAFIYEQKSQSLYKVTSIHEHKKGILP